MANVEVVLDIEKGDIFKSFEEAEQKITQRAKENFVQFYKRESRTIAGGTKKTKRYLNPELKFYQVEWACVHGGRNFKCRGNGVRKCSTLKCEDPCPARIRMKVSPKGNDFIIASVINKHNHSVSKGLFERLPHQRILPPAIKEEVKTFLNLHVNLNKHLLRDEMEKKYNKRITMKDLANISITEMKDSKKVLSQQEKYRLLLTKSQKAASLGMEACGENFDKVSSLFDDIILMLQNNNYEFQFTYEKNNVPVDNNYIKDESSDIVNNGNENIDVSMVDDRIEYIYHNTNDDTVDNAHICSNINVIYTETVQTETFNHDNSDAIIVDNSTENTTNDCPDNVGNSNSNAIDTETVLTETFNHENSDAIVVDNSTENTTNGYTDNVVNSNDIYTETVQTETFNHNSDAIIVDNSTENTTGCPDTVVNSIINISENRNVENDNVDCIPNCDKPFINIIENRIKNACKQSTNVDFNTKTKRNDDNVLVIPSRVKGSRRGRNVIVVSKGKIKK